MKASELEAKSVEIVQLEKLEGKRMKDKQKLRDLRSVMKHNIRKKEVPEGKRKKGAERILEETVAENFSDMLKHSNLHIQDAQQIQTV